MHQLERIDRTRCATRSVCTATLEAGANFIRLLSSTSDCKRILQLGEYQYHLTFVTTVRVST